MTGDNINQNSIKIFGLEFDQVLNETVKNSSEKNWEWSKNEVGVIKACLQSTLSEKNKARERERARQRERERDSERENETVRESVCVIEREREMRAQFSNLVIKVDLLTPDKQFSFLVQRSHDVTSRMLKATTSPSAMAPTNDERRTT